MILFVLTLFPISILIYFFQREKTERAHFLPVIFIGFLVGIIFVAYRLFFSSAVFLPTAYLLKNFLYYLFSQILIPIAVVYGLFFIFTRKDSVADRFSYFFPLVASFYATFIPFIILETDTPYPAFLLFVKPALYLALLIFIHIWLNKAAISKPKSWQVILNVLFLIIFICLPAAVEAIWIINLNFTFWAIPTIVLFLLVGILLFPKSSIQD